MVLKGTVSNCFHWFFYFVPLLIICSSCKQPLHQCLCNLRHTLYRKVHVGTCGRPRILCVSQLKSPNCSIIKGDISQFAQHILKCVMCVLYRICWTRFFKLTYMHINDILYAWDPRVNITFFLKLWRSPNPNFQVDFCLCNLFLLISNQLF